MSASNHDNMAIVITRDGMGNGSPELQHKLIGSWLGLVE